LPEGVGDQSGIFFLDVPISGLTPSPGWYTILDTDDSVSDIITFGNLNFSGPGGSGLPIIRFFSDSGIQFFDLGGGLFPPTPEGNLCTEDPLNGCVGSFDLTLEDGSILRVEVGSDGEEGGVFDPFGFGFDSSDQIRFNCFSGTACELVNVPEPGSLSLFLTALVAGGFGLMWRARARGVDAA
jgi:hypothetical protein